VSPGGPLDRLRCRTTAEPHSHRLVTARQHDPLAIWAELRIMHRPAVPRQCLHALPCRRAPHSHRLVKARRHDRFVTLIGVSQSGITFKRNQCPSFACAAWRRSSWPLEPATAQSTRHAPLPTTGGTAFPKSVHTSGEPALESEGCVWRQFVKHLAGSKA
jgi:hypothetical protein